MTKTLRQFTAIAIALFTLLLRFPAPQPVHAQSAATTIILVRHAEKEATGNDPALSAAGTRRAERLPRVFEKLRPDAFFATPYLRTQQTIAPWAKQTGKTVQSYDPRDQAAFAETLKKQAGKTLVVAGHSNTIPALVNLLLGADQYQPLADTVYSQLWVVEIKNGAATHRKMQY